ncbi:MAG: hypothetical protein WEB62_11485 [Bacteroidota bacterium]
MKPPILFMKRDYRDISGKIDPHLVAAIEDLWRFASAVGTELVVIGATARDIMFEHIYNVRAPRATVDIDIAIRLANWEGFESLKKEMLLSDIFTKDKKSQHRFYHMNGQSFDIIPFGDIEKPRGNIRWANQNDMSTLGFVEAVNGAISCRISPNLVILVSSLPSLVIMKLIAWDEAQPHRQRDAKDIGSILREYINTGIEQRLSDEDQDLRMAPDFDFGIVGPRLMGRDIAKIITPESLQLVMKILEHETKENGYCSLVRDMMESGRNFDEEFEERKSQLKQLMLGILDDLNVTVDQNG